MDAIATKKKRIKKKNPRTIAQRVLLSTNSWKQRSTCDSRWTIPEEIADNLDIGALVPESPLIQVDIRDYSSGEHLISVEVRVRKSLTFAIPADAWVKLIRTKVKQFEVEISFARLTNE